MDLGLLEDNLKECCNAFRHWNSQDHFLLPIDLSLSTYDVRDSQLVRMLFYYVYDFLSACLTFA